VAARLLARPQLLVVALSLVMLALVAQSAHAQSIIYQIRGNATVGSNNIWAINPTTGAETLVYSGYPGGNAATLAQRPSDGLIFYAINNASGTNGAVYTFNPATPSVAPTLLGNIGPSTGGVNVSSGFRMAFSPSGTLYYMVGTGGAADPNTLYTVNQSTGQATKLTTITGAGDGGDMAFDSGGTIHIVDQNRIHYTASVAGGAASNVGTINFGGTTPNTVGIAFDGTGRLLLQTVSAANGGQFWSVSGTTATLIGPISGGGTATGDLASAVVPQPNLSITKTDGVATVYRGGAVTYTIVVTNNGTYSVTGTVTDTVPASVTGVTWTCVASAGSSCAAASGSGNAISTSATLLAGGTATYTVSGTVSAGASGTLINTASVAVPSWLTDSNASDNTATDSDTINLNANLAITKTDGAATVNPGASVTYTIVASNAGPDAATGAAITDTVPALLSSVTWTCGTPTGGATCGAASGSGNSISTTANLPSGGSVTYTVTGTLATNATGTLSNTAQIAAPSGVTDPTAGNNSATDSDSINLVADPSITKSHTGNFTRGTTNSYTVTVSNSGTGATSGTVTMTDTLPTGLTPNGTPTGTGWTCSVASQTITCTRSNALAAGASYPAITITVNVLQTAANSVTNTASVAGGGGNISTSNDSASDATTVVSSADLSLTKTVNNSTPTINTNVTFTLTLSNAGPTNASGVTVTDALPAGLSFVSATPSAGTSYNSGTGVWTIGAVASGANATLQLVTNVTASGTITNTAQVTAANEPDPDSTPNNNNASEDDQASVSLNVPAPPTVTLCKTFPGQTCVPPPSLPAQQPGADVTFVIIFTNTGGSAAQGLTITDGVPANTDFKIGSIITNPGTTGLTVVIYYSYDGGASFVTTAPTSGGGGAPAGYDRTVTHVRWVFTGNLSQSSPNNTGDVRFTTRIR
jgi:uncharacterized repeat protein (TIGR01451 family)/fimbrial isopeptide formation D2 family protein